MKWVIFENGVMIKEKSTEKKGARIFECPEPVVEVIVPEGVTAIGMKAFSGMQDLKSVVLPKGVEEIQEGAFCRCANLTHVVLPEGLATISESAFEGCGSLSSVDLPAGLQTLESYAFADCGMLTELTIPDGTAFDSELFGFSWDHDQISRKCLTVMGDYKDFKFLKQLENLKELHVRSIQAVPASVRPAAAAGFAAEEPQDMTSERAKEHLDYIRRNASKLMWWAFRDPALLRLMCREKLISVKCFDAYIAESSRRGDAELTALLLDYQQNILGSATVEKSRKRQADKREKDADTVIGRSLDRENRKSEDGIAGLVFAITGELESFESRDQAKSFLISQGAKLASGISAKVDYLVTNDVKSGSEKNKKARDMGIQVIDENTFNQLTCRFFQNQEEIVVPGWVRRIESEAFKDCESATRIVLPEGLASIGKQAFAACENLRELYLPDSVAEIHHSAFSYDTDPDFSCHCRQLQAIRVSDQSAYYRSVDGVLFDKDGTTLIHYPAGRIDSSYRVPDGVRVIGECAFQNCQILTGVTFPEGLVEIKEDAFGACTGLRAISIPDGVRIIGEYAFLHCHNLTRVTFPEGLVEIRANAFDSCTGLRAIALPDSLKSVGSESFGRCDDLEDIDIQGDIEQFDPLVFGVSSALHLKALRIKKWIPGLNEAIQNWMIEAIYTELPESVPLTYRYAVVSGASAGPRQLPETIEGLVFSISGKLETFFDQDAIREYLESYGASITSGLSKKVNYLVTNEPVLSEKKAMKAESLGIEVINEMRFNEIIRRRFADQEEVVVPAWVRSIESKAFMNCSRLIRVVLPQGLNQIGKCAFAGCVRLREINLPEGLELIEGDAFSGCAELEHITLPEGLLKIGYDAFANCKKLLELELPASLGSKQWSFSTDSFPELTSIRVSDQSPFYISVDGILYGKDGSSLVCYPAGRREEVFHVPAQVKRIESSAFSHSSLHAVELPEGLEEIGNYAFMGCSLLEAVVIPGSVKKVGTKAFGGCDALKAVVMKGDIQELDTDAFDLKYSYSYGSVECLSVVHWNESLNVSAWKWRLKKIEAVFPEEVPVRFKGLVVKAE